MRSVDHAAARPTTLTTDLSALEQNYRSLRQLTGPNCKICAVVKADAYGLGAAPIAGRLQELGCDYFGVALVEEGRELRAAGISRPIVLLGYLNGTECIRKAVELELEVGIHNSEVLPEIAKVANETGRKVLAHLKVDTGMGRLGVAVKDLFAWCEEARPSGVELKGIYTTFASADDSSSPRTEEQLEKFLKAVEILKSNDFDPPLRHAANSGAMLNFPETVLTMARPGLLLYGIPPSPKPLDKEFKPVATLKSRIIQLSTLPAGSHVGYAGTFITESESRIAVLPIGYADGVNRLLGNHGEVVIRGKRAPIVGRVSMDLTTVDVTDIPGACIGDDVIIVGRDGEEEISVWEVALKAGTIPWEVLCWIGKRVTRIAVNEGEAAPPETGPV